MALVEAPFQRASVRIRRRCRFMLLVANVALSILFAPPRNVPAEKQVENNAVSSVSILVRPIPFWYK